MLISKRPRRAVPNKHPLFYYITDRRQLAGITLISCIKRALDWGIDFIQIREKDLSDRALYELTCRIVSLSSATECRILLNGRADIALAAGAHGVHLPSTGMRIPEIRPWLPREFIVGLSVHTIGEIRDACAQGADYILVGHLFPTSSKESYGRPLGLRFFRKACAGVSTPIFGLGGIRPEFVASVLAAGAAGISGISLFQKNSDFSELRKLAAFIGKNQQ